ncbi:MAG: hypothetical protein IT222_03625 [Crocinitomix sp.]|nr:hypothetical protein [Crocinitomix sp.]
MKKAPVWGKVLGIIMICLGGLGVINQVYKLMVPMMMDMMRDFPVHPANGNPMAAQTGLDVMFGNSNSATMLMILGFSGLAMMALYIVAGAKLLTRKMANYNFAKNVLLIMLVYNALTLIYMWSGAGGMFVKMLAIYGTIGFVFDLTILIILISNDKQEYEAATSSNNFNAIDEIL